MIEPSQPLHERLAIWCVLLAAYSLGVIGLTLPVVGLLYLLGALR